ESVVNGPAVPVVLSCTLTWSSAPRFVVHVCFCVVPNPQFAEAVGAVTLMNTGAIVKLVLLTSLAAPFVQLTRMRVWPPIVAGPLTRQANVPVVAPVFFTTPASVSP